MAWRIVRSGDATEDLTALWAYVAKRDAAAANRLLDRIETRIRRLAEYPGIARACGDILPGLRGFSVGRYLVLYRLDSRRESVEIVRVLHASRDHQALFS
ncbi:MAG: type II toxin-antitoxin system RelE/ParE family toxin [Sphingomonadaceae bacterium]|nr:type II toxin-antitoxin system RelE/ParE family toxin [Sphingomonadaceae bacterium]